MVIKARRHDFALVVLLPITWSRGKRRARPIRMRVESTSELVALISGGPMSKEQP
jgi:hypothetical protein